jgi:alpha-glucosidase (family GH31 glycosyl hydrolase)
MRLDMCGFELMKDPFGFKFVDTRDRSNVLLTTEGSTFVMYDKYMQLDIQLPSRRIYGLGERTHEFTLGEGTWTMWSNGQETPHDDGKGGKQTYGVHPFVLVQTGVKGEYMGLYFRNSNAMSPVIRYTGVSAATFSYITTGGQMEVYFMFKGTAKQIIAQYHDLIGRPALPPFWSLGWHAAAYAYSTQALVEENIKGYSDNNFPLEGVWLDIDFMDGYADFSVNTTAFPTVKALADTLHANGQRMVVIVDAGISGDDVSNPYFAAAAENDVLLRSSINPDQQSGILTQHVWPNHTVFLDFLAPGARDIWAQGLKDLHDQVPYDGLWLDMNEATGFCNGECPSG